MKKPRIQLDGEDFGLFFVLLLWFSYQLATFLQRDLGWGLLVLPVTGIIFLVSTAKRSGLQVPFSLPFLIFMAGIVTWIFWNGFYPERDNDALQFWMPKAKALSLYGYLPAVGIDDPRFTVSHDYPLGLVGLSGFLHRFGEFFSLPLHRLTLFAQAALLWVSLGRLMGPSRRLYWELMMFVLIAPLPALWVNGYHDMLWALSFSLGMAWLIFEENPWKAALYFCFAASGKAEGQLFLFLFVPILAVITRRYSMLLTLIPTTFWIFVTKHHAFAASRHFIFPPHNILTVIDAVMKSMLDLLRFKTLFGSVSLGVLVGTLIFFRLSWRIRWIPMLALAVFMSVYWFSSFDVGWNVLFSWPRVLCFPIIATLVLGGREMKLEWEGRT